jgi:hypothetical protein
VSKLLLLSLILATVGLPLRAAKAERPARALRNSLLALFAFNAFYLLAIRYIYNRL